MKKTFCNLLERAKKSLTYRKEKAILRFTSDIYQAMKSKSQSKADLARLLGTSQAYITKIFLGDANFTLETMVKLANAVDRDLEIKISPRNAKGNFIHSPNSAWSDRIENEVRPTNENISASYHR